MSSNKRLKVGVIYWGSRGGGRDLSEQLIRASLIQGIEVFWSSRAFESHPVDIRAPKDLSSIVQWLKLRRTVVQSFKDLGVEIVILPMTSPWDIYLGKKLSKCGIKVIRIIHDAAPHPGDFWPNKMWIQKLCLDADRLVFLSKYVASEIVTKNNLEGKEVVVQSLPVPDVFDFELHSPKKSEEFREKEVKKVLFMGRGKKYKGLNLLKQAWPLVKENNSRLTIMGEGHKVDLDLPRVSYELGWASNERIIHNIRKHDLIVLPYIEASQSGIIPLCHALKKPVLVTSVGGLAEQVEDGVNGLVCYSLNPNQLASLIDKALIMRWPPENFSNKNSETKFLNTILAR